MSSHAPDPAGPGIPDPIRWRDGELFLLDQRLLPGTEQYLPIRNLDDAVSAIASLAVRGAPAIGIAAAYALVVAMRADVPAAESAEAFGRRLGGLAERLRRSRPTAVNLAWATARMERRALRSPTSAALTEEAEAIHRENRAICLAIGRHGESLIAPGATLLTHCNAGSLAVSGLGTATAPMYLRHQAGVPFRVFVDETRPLLQGARLTAWELDRAGIDVTLICDSMAASLMAEGAVDLVLVGTDRVTGNGDVINKIGTLNLAVLCHHYQVPFYVACPSTSYDPDTGCGADVVIEQRHPDEVLGTAAARVAVHNPAFDVTPAALVTGIITENGIATAPLADNLTRLLRP